MIRTRVGYTGGNKLDPNYLSLGDHTEAIQIDFDPRRLSYDRLLEIFWKSHNPSSRNWSRQYMNAIFYHDSGQQQLALQTQAELAQKGGRKIRTRILPLVEFYRAENYHQKYMLRKEPEFLRALQRAYPKQKDLVDSTAAARLNGYLGGYGNWKQLKNEIDLLGLSPESRWKLERMVRRSSN